MMKIWTVCLTRERKNLTENNQNRKKIEMYVITNTIFDDSMTPTIYGPYKTEQEATRDLEEYEYFFEYPVVQEVYSPRELETEALNFLDEMEAEDANTSD